MQSREPVRVFLVEDLWTMRELIQSLCETVGGIRIVATAAGEGEAKLWMDAHPGEWDVAILDLVLDDGSGMGVVRHAAGLPARGRIVVFSSYASPNIVTHCMRLGADAAFEKSDTEGFVRWLAAQAAPGG